MGKPPAQNYKVVPEGWFLSQKFFADEKLALPRNGREIENSHAREILSFKGCPSDLWRKSCSFVAAQRMPGSAKKQFSCPDLQIAHRGAPQTYMFCSRQNVSLSRKKRARARNLRNLQFVGPEPKCPRKAFQLNQWRLRGALLFKNAAFVAAQRTLGRARWAARLQQVVFHMCFF